MDSQIKEKALKILNITQGNICEHCLGRKFSKEIEGPGNPLRGNKIRNIMALEIGYMQYSGKCLVCDNLFEKLDQTSKKVEEKIKYLDLEYSSFLVGTKVNPKIMEQDEKLSSVFEVEVETIKKKSTES